MGFALNVLHVKDDDVERDGKTHVQSAFLCMKKVENWKIRRKQTRKL